MFIHVHDPTLNRNLRKYQLPRMGQPTTGITNITAQALQPLPHLPPKPYPPPQPHPLPLTAYKGGGMYFS